jgi:hypothetical protein
MSADEHAEVEAAVEAVGRREGRDSLSLWFAVLGSPLAWVVHLGLSYSLEEWFACSSSARHRGEIMGLGVDTVALIVNLAMAGLAALAGLVSYTCWRKLQGEAGDETTDRARWMAFAGMVEAALFLGIILLGLVPPLALGTCETTP